MRIPCADDSAHRLRRRRMSRPQREDVRFRSQGVECGAWIYPSGGPQPGPCLVLAHGFDGVRDQRLDRYAERFADSGWNAFVFDYRHFGDSEGSRGSSEQSRPARGLALGDRLRPRVARRSTASGSRSGGRRLRRPRRPIGRRGRSELPRSSPRSLHRRALGAARSPVPRRRSPGLRRRSPWTGSPRSPAASRCRSRRSRRRVRAGRCSHPGAFTGYTSRPRTA